MFYRKYVAWSRLSGGLLCCVLMLGMWGLLRFDLETFFTHQHPQPQVIKRKVVILMTQCRSGSSFTGEIFSASDGMMYLYEPLLPFSMDCTTLEDRKFAFLSRMLNCNFTGLQTEYHVGFNTTHFPDYGDCVSKGFCFPFASIGLLKGYAHTCNRLSYSSSTATKFNPKSRKCGFPLKEDILSQQCSDAPILFTKVTRACSLNQIEQVYDFLRRNGSKVYVIHLVRDPRSTVYSRMKAWKEDPTWLSKEICGRIRKNLELLQELKPGKGTVATPSLVTDGRYLRLRFEDLATDAVGWAERIYRLIGDNLPPEVEKNILDHLQQSSSQVKKMLANKKRSNKAQEILREMNSPFTTVRDSQEVLRRWRKTIAWNMVVNVQTECGDVMKSLGYHIFEDEAAFRNTSNPFFVMSN